MNGTTSVVGWDLNSPADTEVAGLGDDRIRSVKSSAQAALNDEHNFPSSDGTGFGYHRYGSARPYFGTQSRVSSDGTDARLMLTSDTSRLFAMTSAGTIFVGGQNVPSMNTAPSTLPQRHVWMDSMGTGITDTSGFTRITFPSPYSGAPFVILTGGSGVSDIASNIKMVQVLRSQTTGADVGGYYGDPASLSTTTVGLALGAVLFTWFSRGTVAV